MKTKNALRATTAGLLLIALGAGGAEAGRQLTGRDISNGSIGSVDIRDGSIRPADLSASVGGRPGPRGLPGPAGSAGPAGPQGPAGEAPKLRPITFTALSDSHMYNGNSWFRVTVEAGQVPAATVRDFVSYPGADANGLREVGLPRIPGSEIVIVSAGTNDFFSAKTVNDVSTALKRLVMETQQLAPVVLLSLVPPSDRFGLQTVQLNQDLRTWADDAGVQVLDVFSPVADPDGTWREGTSGDGIHATDLGAGLQAKAVLPQLGFVAERTRAVLD